MPSGLVPPFSLELGFDEDAKDVIVGNITSLPAGKMAILVNSGCNAAKRQPMMGVIKAMFRKLKNSNVSTEAGAGDVFAYGHHTSATTNTITVATDATGAVPTDIILGVEATFPRSSQMQTETAKQLVNKYLELTAGN